jgi:hypothetical protein
MMVPRGGQRVGLDRYGSKRSTRPKPRFELYGPYRPKFYMRVTRVRVDQICGFAVGFGWIYGLHLQTKKFPSIVLS